MQKKTCPRCGEAKDIDEFSWKSKASGRRHSECKSCHATMRRSHYEKTGEQQRQRIRERKREIAAQIAEIRAGLSCLRCGETHPATLDFHHRDPSEKSVNIAHVAYDKGWHMGRVRDEIAKCDVLCANCHRKEHWGQRRAA